MHEANGANSQSLPSLCLSWPSSSIWLLPPVFSRTILPSCVHIFPHLCIPVGLQCTFLLLPQLTEVHSLHFQHSRPAHHLLCPPRVSRRLPADATGVAFRGKYATGLPVVPVLAVIFFHDKMDRIKVLAMVLAIWGFVSDLYQHYLDDRMSKTANNENAICER
ncbi:Probable purine permease 6 [Prunus dulcis]|uniref:Probable purine permease 6 n=1 Tax=Prunus dulcis TaxID=3755 RepID=A0A4Y1RCA1_PRUDU|nr:Probable purine permease 6 [Prunus dulcis]